MSNNRCIPPIRWLQRTFVPPQSNDWMRISFQPMLYLGTWVAAILVVTFGDFSYLAVHPGITDFERANRLFWVWNGLALIAPPLALLSLWMINSKTGTTRYRGFWWRTGADLMQFVAMTIYIVLRLSLGDFHVYPVAVLCSADLFVFHLLIRDIKRLLQVEKLARAIHQNGDVP